MKLCKTGETFPAFFWTPFSQPMNVLQFIQVAQSKLNSFYSPEEMSEIESFLALSNSQYLTNEGSETEIGWAVEKF